MFAFSLWCGGCIWMNLFLTMNNKTDHIKYWWYQLLAIQICLKIQVSHRFAIWFLQNNRDRGFVFLCSVNEPVTSGNIWLRLQRRDIICTEALMFCYYNIGASNAPYACPVGEPIFFGNQPRRPSIRSRSSMHVELDGCCVHQHTREMLAYMFWNNDYFHAVIIYTWHIWQGPSNHRQVDCLLNSLPWLSTDKPSKLRSLAPWWGFHWWPLRSLQRGQKHEKFR